jgi:2-oxoglutarate ferredoxin oxidoreductase subunit alpha
MRSLSLALVGSGGAGVVTAGGLLLAAAARTGSYAMMRRSSGPQIRGGESAALLRFADQAVECADDSFDLLLACDWRNVDRFVDEIPLGAHSLVLYDPAAGEVPALIADCGPRLLAVPLADVAASVHHGRINMVALGVIAHMLQLDASLLASVITDTLAHKGHAAVAASHAAVAAGRELGRRLAVDATGSELRLPATAATDAARWTMTGNEACGLGALRGEVRFVAAYPITPASELLEWLAPRIEALGGTLLQAEDELASVNMIMGASFGGVASLTATSGPGLALMMEGLGLAVASETPVVVVNVMRGGPSTGIPTKSEQTDLNIALYGMHGEAPHIVLAPLSIGDGVLATQWAVHLAESLQTAVIVLSDQLLGQSRAVLDRPADVSFMRRRRVAGSAAAAYQRYVLTADGVSPMAIPGSSGMAYTADGLEHDQAGIPSTRARDHAEQLAKRERKLAEADYGPHWGEVSGDGSTAVITWGSCTGAVREAVQRLRASGNRARLIALRLLSPLPAARVAEALSGVERLLVVEQSHSAQFYRYLRSQMDLPARTDILARAGPVPIAPGEISARLQAGS